jgi:hypothetical protein
VLQGVFVALLVANVVVFMLYRAAMHSFDADWDHSSSFSLPHLRGDPRQAMRSDVIATSPCHFQTQVPCSEEQTNSAAVTTLRTEVLPNATRHLIDTYSYPSAYDIVRNLLANGDEQDVPTLLANDVFETPNSEVQDDIGSPVKYKANFANKWYLVPAASYAAHHREYDAVTLFKQYLSIMHVSVANGHWLSQPGLDATDLPPIAEIFCAHNGDISYDDCILGLVKVIAPNMRNFLPNAVFTGSSSDTADIGRAYGALPSFVKTNALQDYFAIWSWDGTSLPEPQHGNLPQDQLAAWNYAFAIRLLVAARNGQQCVDTLGRSQGLLSTVAESGDSLGYFSGPARRRLDFISRKRNDICATGGEEQ